MTTAHDDVHDAHDAWARRHDGLDPRGSRWVTGWVRLADRVAAPLADRGVSPDAVTGAGVALAAAVPSLAALGAAWPLAAAPVAVAAALLDSVDGAVASRTGRTTAWGRVLDPVADRVGDLLLALALVVLGAPVWLGVLLGAAALLHESLRSSAQLAGLDGPGAVTVAERPTRVIVTTVVALLCGLEWTARAAGLDVVSSVDGDVIATVGAAVGLLLAAVGGAHLLVVVRRELAQVA